MVVVVEVLVLGLVLIPLVVVPVLVLAVAVAIAVAATRVPLLFIAAEAFGAGRDCLVNTFSTRTDRLTFHRAALKRFRVDRTQVWS